MTQQIIKRGSGKIPTHYGIPDYYKYYKQNYDNPVDSKRYHKVISELHIKLVDAIINNGFSFNLSPLTYNISIRKIKKVPTIKDGKLVNTIPVNYKETMQLWRENEEARENKILIRHVNHHTSKYVFRIKMLKSKANYANAKYYKFKPCRNFQRSLAERIFDEDKENFDTYQLY